MTKSKKLLIYGFLSVIIIAVILIMMRHRPPAEVAREIRPAVGDIRTVISATATVQPQNRLEIKPPINGRIDEILVKEGEKVAAGQTLAWMSSTERAALLDAARARGPEAMKYWADVYKPTPLISPIDGEIIVSITEPGQTITAADVVVVLSDRLIVQAQVDETDVGKVNIGQDVAISLDAYPDIKAAGKVDHIYYESKMVNNVNIYQVDILPDTVPPVFRSGMTATVNIVEMEKNGVLVIPLEVVKRDKDGDYVLISRGIGKKTEERRVELGLSDERNAEVLSGLSEEDRILVGSRKIVLSDAPKPNSNPLMPSMGRGRR